MEFEIAELTEEPAATPGGVTTYPAESASTQRGSDPTTQPSRGAPTQLGMRSATQPGQVAATQPDSTAAPVPGPRRVIVPDLLGGRVLTVSHQGTVTQILLIIGAAPTE